MTDQPSAAEPCLNNGVQLYGPMHREFMTSCGENELIVQGGNDWSFIKPETQTRFVQYIRKQGVLSTSAHKKENPAILDAFIEWASKTRYLNVDRRFDSWGGRTLFEMPMVDAMYIGWCGLAERAAAVEPNVTRVNFTNADQAHKLALSSEYGRINAPGMAVSDARTPPTSTIETYDNWADVGAPVERRERTPPRMGDYPECNGILHFNPDDFGYNFAAGIDTADQAREAAHLLNQLAEYIDGK